MNNNNKSLSIKESSSPRNVVGDLPLTCRCKTKRFFPYLTNSTNKGDSRQKHSGMTAFFNNTAFTLIELLVVVLIIGILAAVAVPQYQKAVEKARLMQNIVTVRALYDALEVYRLANGEYPPAKNNTPGTTDISYFNDLLGINIQTDQKINYYPSLFISQSSISINWDIGGGPGKGKLICSAGAEPTEKQKTRCLSVCSDKQLRTWAHGEYCII